MPSVRQQGPAGQRIEWKLPVYNSVRRILTNPVYAGAYTFGRTTSRTRIENGRKRIVRGIRQEMDDWNVLIRDHHDGYIDWDTYERNQRVIANNANGTYGARGAVRRGNALLAGLLRCGHCGRRLHVAYGGKRGQVPRYHCRGAHINHGTARCISFGALRVDEAVGAAVCSALQPLGVEAALLAIEERGKEQSHVIHQAELCLEEARFQSNQARRRYEAVDPENRLVAANLEQLWNSQLETVQAREDRLADLRSQRQMQAPTAQDKAAYLSLGADLERVWAHEQVTPQVRKNILRTVIEEIVVTVQEGRIRLLLHWQGGDHTELMVRKNRPGAHRWSADADTVEVVRQLARVLPDMSIAALLNRAGKRTGRGNSWTETRVRSFRSSHDIAVYREGERRERGELILKEAADRLGVSEATVRRLIQRGIIPAHQACKGAPWVIAEKALNAPQVVLALEGPLPPSRHPDQEVMDFQ